MAADSAGTLRLSGRLRTGMRLPRARAREELLSVSPVAWLASAGPDYRKIAWLITGAFGVAVLIMGGWAREVVSARTLVQYGAGPFGFLLKWMVALHACRFFVEARRNGALEMLLCTPLTSRQILDGQLLALRRNFLWPGLTMAALLFVPAVHRAFTARAWSGSDILSAVLEFVGASFYCVRMYADCAAITWFGMWLALKLRKPSLAPSLTILFVLILPSALCWLDVFADLFFISWGMLKLRQQDLRSLVARQYQAAGVGVVPRAVR